MLNSQKVISFWLNNLERWDQKRYESRTFLNPILERQRHAAEFLGPFVQGKRVLELGCGKGRLGKILLNKGASSWTGVDICQLDVSSPLKFIKSSIQDLELRDDYDIVISLGLIDWLNDEDISKVLKISEGKSFFHTFSLDNNSLSLFFHKIFSMISYKRSFGVSPRKFRAKVIKNFIKSDERVIFLNNPKMLFSTVVTNMIK